MLGISVEGEVVVAVGCAATDGVAAAEEVEPAAGGKLTPPEGAEATALGIDIVGAGFVTEGLACTICGTGDNPPADTAEVGETFDDVPAAAAVAPPAATAGDIGCAPYASSGPGGTLVEGYRSGTGGAPTGRTFVIEAPPSGGDIVAAPLRSPAEYLACGGGLSGGDTRPEPAKLGESPSPGSCTSGGLLDCSASVGGSEGGLLVSVVYAP
jgi:hypothetical protein